MGCQAEAVLRLHSVTVLPLRVAPVAHTGATALNAEIAGTLALKQRAPIVLSTCAPRVEAIPDKIESNPVELIP